MSFCLYSFRSAAVRFGSSPSAMPLRWFYAAGSSLGVRRRRQRGAVKTTATGKRMLCFATWSAWRYQFASYLLPFSHRLVPIYRRMSGGGAARRPDGGRRRTRRAVNIHYAVTLAFGFGWTTPSPQLTSAAAQAATAADGGKTDNWRAVKISYSLLFGGKT